MVACSVLIVGHLPVLVMQQFLEYDSFPGTVLQASLHCYPVAVAQPKWGEVMIYIMALYHLCSRMLVFHLWFRQSHIMWFTNLVLSELFILSCAGLFLRRVGGVSFSGLC